MPAPSNGGALTLHGAIKLGKTEVPSQTVLDRGTRRYRKKPGGGMGSMKLLTEYIERAVQLEKLAEAEPSSGFKSQLLNQADAF
jgi:hypothetical protein